MLMHLQAARILWWHPAHILRENSLRSLQPAAEDQHIVDMTQIGLLGSDRQGAIVEKGIEGETRSYNGTDYTYYTASDLKMTQNDDGSVYYDVTIRDDLTFSDGTPITIDDVIFSMYVYCGSYLRRLCNSLQPADPWSGGVPGRYGNPGFPDRSSRQKTTQTSLCGQKISRPLSGLQ